MINAQNAQVFFLYYIGKIKYFNAASLSSACLLLFFIFPARYGKKPAHSAHLPQNPYGYKVKNAQNVRKMRRMRRIIFSKA